MSSVVSPTVSLIWAYDPRVYVRGTGGRNKMPPARASALLAPDNDVPSLTERPTSF
jgi:hypothetical protein